MIERRKPGDIRRAVRAGLLAGQTRRQIVDNTDLAPKQVYGAQQGMVLEEFLDPMTLRPRREERQNSTMFAKDSIIPDIGPFLGMWMITLEVQRAMVIAYGATYGYDVVKHAAEGGRKGGYKGLRRFTKDEIKAVQKEALHHHKDQISGRVAQWLDTAAVILTHSSHRVPGSREEWKDRIVRYKQKGLVDEESTAEKWKLLARLYYDNERPLPVDWSEEGLRDERVFAMHVMLGEKNRRLWENKEYREQRAQTNRDRAVIVPALAPLVQRRIPSWHMGHIAEFLPTQVRDAAVGLRRQHGIIVTLEDKREAAIGRHAGKKRNEMALPTAGQEKEFSFVRQFRVEHITNDLSMWNHLCALYQQEGKELPYEPADRLRLEIYLKGFIALQRKDPSLFLQYHRAGREIDAEWFTQLEPHERFIARKLCNPWADGEDEKGLYRIVNGGSRGYVVVTNADGDPAYDTSVLTIRRLLQKVFSQEGASKRTKKKEH